MTIFKCTDYLCLDNQIVYKTASLSDVTTLDMHAQGP